VKEIDLVVMIKFRYVNLFYFWNFFAYW